MRSKAEKSAINLAYYYENKERVLATMRYTRVLKIKKIPCDYCKSLFRPSKFFRKYCSDECRYEATRVKKIRRYQCAYCKDWKETYLYNQRYCCLTCKHKAAYKKRGFGMNMRKRAVNKIIKDLAKVKYTSYTQSELDYIWVNVNKMSVREIALALGRSYASVTHKTPAIRLEKRLRKEFGKAKAIKGE